MKSDSSTRETPVSVKHCEPERKECISISMVTYNHEKYITEAIQSILDQTFTNFELIIVNDGSTDKTEAMIKSFIDPRITYIYQQNQGPSVAINTAVMAAHGKYLAIMSGDDVCYPHRLQTQYDYLRNASDCKIVFSRADFIDDDSNLIAHEWGENIFNRTELKSREEMWRHLFYQGNFLNAPTCMLERDLLIEAGLFDPCSIQLQDFAMWINLLKKHNVYVLPQKLIKYRFRDGNGNLSSFARSSRAMFEWHQLGKNIFTDVSISFFKKVFADVLRKADFSEDVEYELEKAFLFLSHDLEIFKAIGVEKLFVLLKNKDIAVVAREKYNFGFHELFELMSGVKLFDKNLEIKILEENIQKQNLQLVELSDHVAVLDKQIIGLQGNIQKKNSQLMALDTQLQEVKQDLQETADRLHREEVEIMGLKNSRSWRITLPLRNLTALLRRIKHKLAGRGNLNSSLLFAEENNQLVGTKDPILLPKEYPLLPKQVGHDYFFWAIIDWHFRIQRPQHLARNLAGLGHRVFYFSNEFIDSEESGFEVEALDEKNCLYQIKLYVKNSPAIYFGTPLPNDIVQIRQGLLKFMCWTGSQQVLSLVQHPYWLEIASRIPNSRLVYDCMDHHGGFENTATGIVALEEFLVKKAELLVVTSSWLQQEMRRDNTNIAIIRNGCEYQHFCTAPNEIYHDELNRDIIGYYGALDEWFDIPLIEMVATHFADCLILLIGRDTCGMQQKLQHLENVKFTGEVSYQQLPFYLHAFAVCLLPFKVIPLTLATNPVKVYEYLSAGKSVVSVDLPEIHQFEGLVSIASDAEQFIEHVAALLSVKSDSATIATRQAFAAQQTWAHRVEQLNAVVNRLVEPLVSIIVVTYNNLAFTKTCLQSIIEYTDYSNYEVIIVDNASSDDSPEYLQQICQQQQWTLILNADNRGFSAANNQGLAAARGDYLLILNNDTAVTLGWLRTLVNHMQHDRSIGLIGPVTNNIGNEARVETLYTDVNDRHGEARELTLVNMGKLFHIRTLAFFCVMLSRHTYAVIGGLDEVFGLGFFEDDDYCRRVEQAGLQIMCAQDVFVHHHLSASFNKLPTVERQQLFEKNKAVYENKWGPWIPHQYRPSNELTV